MTTTKDTKAELTTRVPEDLAQKVPPATSLFEVFERAARDPKVDIDKLERLLAMKERAEAQERERLFADSMARAQKEMPQIDKHGRISGSNGNVRNTYAKLEDIDEFARPIYTREGFSLIYGSEVLQGGSYRFFCEVMHQAGHKMLREIVLPVDEGAGRNKVQSIGSSESYAKRRLLKMIFNIVEKDEDNDGNGPEGFVSPEQADELLKMLVELEHLTEGATQKFLKWAKLPAVEEPITPKPLRVILEQHPLRSFDASKAAVQRNLDGARAKGSKA